MGQQPVPNFVALGYELDHKRHPMYSPHNSGDKSQTSNTLSKRSVQLYDDWNQLILRVHATIVLAIVGYLSPPAPDHFPTCCN